MYKLLKFSANWCNPCKQMTKELHKTPLQGVDVEEIDVEQSDDMIEIYNISNLPTLILKDEDGKVLWRHTGYMTIQQIQQSINQIIQ